MPVAAFVEALQNTPAMERVSNPWADHCIHDGPADAAAIRREHLRRYLEQRVRSARLVICGEAPGYKGCKHAGIAMTSERILLGNAETPADAVFLGAKQRTSAVTAPHGGGERGAVEPTATIVWGIIQTLGVDPYSVVFWNAFAFHPHEAEAPLTNRQPSRAELAAARPLLEQFVGLFPNAKVAAMGDVAAGALGTLATTTMRHPSYGGAPLFRQQMTALLGGGQDNGG